MSIAVPDLMHFMGEDGTTPVFEHMMKDLAAELHDQDNMSKVVKSIDYK